MNTAATAEELPNEDGFIPTVMNGNARLEENQGGSVANDASLETLAYEREHKHIFYRFIKRAFDIGCSTISLILLSPLFLVIAILVKKEDGGSIIYRRWCVGKDQKPFPMYKFRTMVPDAEKKITSHLTDEQLAQWKTGFKVDEDPRVTRIGRGLRKASLDELPQLMNILKGEMSLIGPRPVTKREYDSYGAKGKVLVCVRPGITGYWQVTARGDVAYLSEDAQNLQLYYAENANLALDTKIFFKTFAALLHGSK